MDAEALIGSLLRGTLTGRRKKGHGALRYLTGGSGSLINANTILTAAGIAWGLFESAGSGGQSQGGGGQWGAFPSPRGGVPSAPGPQAPPLPPIPAPAAPGQSSAADVPADVLRIVRLIISAARADGSLSEAEAKVILSHAKDAGAEEIVGRELQAVHPLSEIVGTVADPEAQRNLYSLAFTIVHADQGVSGAERIYLAQLANLLGIDPDTASQLEQKVVSGIVASN